MPSYPKDLQPDNMKMGCSLTYFSFLQEVKLDWDITSFLFGPQAA